MEDKRLKFAIEEENKIIAIIDKYVADNCSLKLTLRDLEIEDMIKINDYVKIKEPSRFYYSVNALHGLIKATNKYKDDEKAIRKIADLYKLLPIKFYLREHIWGLSSKSVSEIKERLSITAARINLKEMQNFINFLIENNILKKSDNTLKRFKEVIKKLYVENTEDIATIVKEFIETMYRMQQTRDVNVFKLKIFLKKIITELNKKKITKKYAKTIKSVYSSYHYGQFFINIIIRIFAIKHNAQTAIENLEIINQVDTYNKKPLNILTETSFYIFSDNVMSIVYSIISDDCKSLTEEQVKKYFQTDIEKAILWTVLGALSLFDNSIDNKIVDIPEHTKFAVIHTHVDTRNMFDTLTFTDILNAILSGKAKNSDELISLLVTDTNNDYYEEKKYIIKYICKNFLNIE